MAVMTATRTAAPFPPQGRPAVRFLAWGADPVAPRSPGTVEVWTWAFGDGGLTASDEAMLRADLTPDESARATRYRHPRAREQFLRSRALLRQLLAANLGCEPRDLAIEPNADGKPRMLGGGPEFNVSHTDGVLTVALADGPVGVDVECLRPMPSATNLVERYFSEPERRQFEKLPEADRLAGFFRGWTCKEAVLKGIGCGVRDLDRCVVDLDPARPAAVLAPTETACSWALRTWHPTAGTVAALAVCENDAAPVG
jgi:4'-phosphopantetheinyl transferase